jgi:hypothetical protein
MPNQKTGSKEEELQMAEPGRLDPSAQEARQVDRLAFTLDAETGEILKYEAVDAAGVRRELSQNERVELAKIRGGEAVEDLIERGFEAGLACLLGGADEPEVQAALTRGEMGDKQSADDYAIALRLVVAPNQPTDRQRVQFRRPTASRPLTKLDVRRPAAFDRSRSANAIHAGKRSLGYRARTIFRATVQESRVSPGFVNDLGPIGA